MGETFAFWDKALKDIADLSRSGAVDPVGAARVPMEGLSDDGCAVFTHLEEAQKLGLPLLVTLQAMRQELRAARHMVEKRAAAVRLMLLKSVLMCGMALLLRFFLSWRSEGATAGERLLKLWGTQDAQAILLGILWLGLGAACWGSIIPHSWLWVGKISPLGVRWFAAHLTAADGIGDPWSEDLQRIKQNAWLQGIPSMAETRQSLEAWAQEKNHQVETRLRHMEELFPLWEMVVLGLSTVLFLVVPVLSELMMMGQDSNW